MKARSWHRRTVPILVDIVREPARCEVLSTRKTMDLARVHDFKCNTQDHVMKRSGHDSTISLAKSRRAWRAMLRHLVDLLIMIPNGPRRRYV